MSDLKSASRQHLGLPVMIARNPACTGVLMSMAAKSKMPTDDFLLQDWPFFWMTQAAGRYIQKLDRSLKKVGLDVSRWRVLMAATAGKSSVSEIADLAIVKLPTMMKIVQRMEADGMVTCERRPTDGRFVNVVLTQKGRDARKLAWDIAQRIYASSFAEVSAKERRCLNTLLKHVFDRLGD